MTDFPAFNPNDPAIKELRKRISGSIYPEDHLSSALESLIVDSENFALDHMPDAFILDVTHLRVIGRAEALFTCLNLHGHSGGKEHVTKEDREAYARASVELSKSVIKNSAIGLGRDVMRFVRNMGYVTLDKHLDLYTHYNDRMQGIRPAVLPNDIDRLMDFMQRCNVADKDERRELSLRSLLPIRLRSEHLNHTGNDNYKSKYQALGMKELMRSESLFGDPEGFFHMSSKIGTSPLNSPNANMTKEELEYFGAAEARLNGRLI